MFGRRAAPTRRIFAEIAGGQARSGRDISAFHSSTFSQPQCFAFAIFRWHGKCFTKPETPLHGGNQMLYYALVFLVIALIAGALGFGGIAGTAAGIAHILFVIFLVLFVLSLVFGLVRRPRI
jgi:uncharacterized membrane protein YtjA (UPF0391 family)